jgi:hypothetical protein
MCSVLFVLSLSIIEPSRDPTCIQAVIAIMLFLGLSVGCHFTVGIAADQISRNALLQTQMCR